MSTQNLGIVTAYGYAKEKGYTGTLDQFKQLMYDVSQSQGEINRLDGEIGDLKEDFNDLSDYGYVPTAGQMMSDNVTVDTEPYSFRATPYGDREIVDAIVGGSIVWNQLIDSDDTSISIQPGHKCIMRINGSWGVGIDAGAPIPVTGGSDMCFDITMMFGASVGDAVWNAEIATPSSAKVWFRKMFPDEYYPYNEGELMSVSGLSAHETVGKNFFDGSKVTTTASNNWSVTWYDNALTVQHKNTYSTGVPRTPVLDLPDGTYTVSYVSSIPNIDIYRNGSYSETLVSGGTFTVNGEETQIAFPNNSATTVTYTNVQIERGSAPTTYEPYTKHIYALDDSLTLMGVPKWDNGLKFDGDVYGADGSVERRYGIVDLSTLTWGDSGSYWASGALTDAKVPDSGGTKANIISDNYVTVTSNGVSGGTEQGIGLRPNGGLYCTDTGASPTGYLVYELKTPTTETAEPYQQIQVCPNGGTEEYISTSIVPVGHSTRYPENSRMKLDGLPWDFSTLIAPTEKAYKATRNYTTGQLLIVNNVLYKVTANIANGGTITPNTNVTATTLSEVIASL